MKDLVTRRAEFEALVAEARANAADLGHDLHAADAVDGNPWHVAAFCRRCGAGVAVRLGPDDAVSVQGYGLVDRCGS